MFSPRVERFSAEANDIIEALLDVRSLLDIDKAEERAHEFLRTSTNREEKAHVRRALEFTDKMRLALGPQSGSLRPRREAR